MINICYQRFVYYLFFASFSCCLLTTSCTISPKTSTGSRNLTTFENIHLFDVANNRYTDLVNIIHDLKKNSIILIGEQHDNKSHHISQLQIIKALHTSNKRMAIGLEMFRSESQHFLDLWVNGDITGKNFQEAYTDNWNFPISLYMMIFEFGKKEKIPLVGLNIPRSITFNIAKGGFQSLTKEEKEKLQNIVCKVDPDYEAYIKSAYGSHAHGNFNFTNFCEAQLAWDTIMAINSLKYLENNQNTLMIVLSGFGHSLKWGIPEQIRKRSIASYKAILPYVPGFIDPNSTTIKDVDYIIMSE